MPSLSFGRSYTLPVTSSSLDILLGLPSLHSGDPSLILGYNHASREIVAISPDEKRIGGVYAPCTLRLRPQFVPDPDCRLRIPLLSFCDGRCLRVLQVDEDLSVSMIFEIPAHSSRLIRAFSWDRDGHAVALVYDNFEISVYRFEQPFSSLLLSGQISPDCYSSTNCLLYASFGSILQLVANPHCSLSWFGTASPSRSFGDEVTLSKDSILLPSSSAPPPPPPLPAVIDLSETETERQDQLDSGRIQLGALSIPPSMQNVFFPGSLRLRELDGMVAEEQVSEEEEEQGGALFRLDLRQPVAAAEEEEEEEEGESTVLRISLETLTRLPLLRPDVLLVDSNPTTSPCRSPRFLITTRLASHEGVFSFDTSKSKSNRVTQVWNGLEEGERIIGWSTVSEEWRLLLARRDRESNRSDSLSFASFSVPVKALRMVVVREKEEEEKLVDENVMVEMETVVEGTGTGFEDRLSSVEVQTQRNGVRLERVEEMVSEQTALLQAILQKLS